MTIHIIHRYVNGIRYDTNDDCHYYRYFKYYNNRKQKRRRKHLRIIEYNDEGIEIIDEPEYYKDDIFDMIIDKQYYSKRLKKYNKNKFSFDERIGLNELLYGIKSYALNKYTWFNVNSPSKQNIIDICEKWCLHEILNNIQNKLINDINKHNKNVNTNARKDVKSEKC